MLSKTGGKKSEDWYEINFNLFTHYLLTQQKLSDKYCSTSVNTAVKGTYISAFLGLENSMRR